MSALRGWGLPEQHLALDALVAFVDGELSPGAYDRAAAHIAGCSSCAADASAQRQARSAVSTAAAPSISPQFLQSLQSIPTEAELPEQPDGLALTEDGQLVTVDHRPRGSRTLSDSLPGSGRPLGHGGRRFVGGSRLGRDVAAPLDHPVPTKGHGRRTKQGASVVFSGIVLGALAFMNVPGDEPRNTVTTVPRPFPPPGGVGSNGVMPALTTDAAKPERTGRVTSPANPPSQDAEAPVSSDPTEPPTTASSVPPEL